MRRLAAALLLAVSLSLPATAQPIVNSPVPVALPSPAEIAACLEASAKAHEVPVFILVLLLRTENGRLGRVTPNASGAPPDVGPIQVNAMWLPRLAARWGVSKEDAFLALRDSFCANVEAGTWILRQSLDRRTGNFWNDVAGFHSRTPVHRERYLRNLHRHAQALLQPAGEK